MVQSGNKKMFECYVNNWIFGEAPLAEVFQRIAGIGFDGVELMGEPALYDGKEVAQLAGDFGLKVISLCGMHPGPSPDDLRALGHPDAKERQRAVDYVTACIDLAVEVQARSVLVVPSLVGQPTYFSSREEDWQRVVDSLAKCAEYAASQGILITIEPINRYEVSLVNTIGDAIRMAEAVNSPQVRVMGDTFHMQMEEGDGIPAAIRRAGGYWLQHIHFADNTRVAPGLGTLPWREIIRALKEIDYQGAISFEPLPRWASPYDVKQGRFSREELDENLRFGLEYIRLMQEIVATENPD